MRIKTKLSQHRRDFTAIYMCDSCGAEVEGHGYDDQYFHTQVIPDMACAECGAKGSGPTSRPDVPEEVVL